MGNATDKKNDKTDSVSNSRPSSVVLPRHPWAFTRSQFTASDGTCTAALCPVSVRQIDSCFAGPDDTRLLQAISHSEFQISGFGNRDLRPMLFDKPASPTTVAGHRQSAKVTRLLRLLRGHKLISKIPRSHRYRLTKRGRIQITATLTAQNANTAKLTELAA